jgi:hypothetical protein
LRFQNANGGDLLLYPGFIVMVGEKNNFALIDFREIKIEHHAQSFIETNVVPKDSKVIYYTWKFVNKNGTRDKRYKNNFQIPIVFYYEITIKSNKGLCGSYQFSNAEIGEKFCCSLESYRASLQKMNWKKDANDEII